MYPPPPSHKHYQQVKLIAELLSVELPDKNGNLGVALCKAEIAGNFMGEFNST